jgi:hypothetical protein
MNHRRAIAAMLVSAALAMSACGGNPDGSPNGEPAAADRPAPVSPWQVYYDLTHPDPAPAAAVSRPAPVSPWQVYYDLTHPDPAPAAAADRPAPVSPWQVYYDLTHPDAAQPTLSRRASPNGVLNSSPSALPVVTRLVTGLANAAGSGSTIGPDRALYVTESTAGRVVRIDPNTGAVTTFASGLPLPIRAVGGAMDVAFIHGTAYVLVTLVGTDIGGSDVVGIYRVDGPNTFTVIADIGAFSIANPPTTPFGVPTGVQYAMQAHRRGFLVTDGHHNRVLQVSLDGEVSEVIPFDNIVPTGLDIRGNRVYLAEAGPVPHLPETGKIVSFKAKSPTVADVASGARLLVDVEFGRGTRLYGLSQGVFPDGGVPGAPALPNTGSLLKVTRDGGFDAIVDELDRPTSIEFIRNTAYVVTLGGEVWKIDHVAPPPHRTSR